MDPAAHPIQLRLANGADLLDLDNFELRLGCVGSPTPNLAFPLLRLGMVPPRPSSAFRMPRSYSVCSKLGQLPDVFPDAIVRFALALADVFSLHTLDTGYMWMQK